MKNFCRLSIGPPVDICGHFYHHHFHVMKRRKQEKLWADFWQHKTVHFCAHVSGLQAALASGLVLDQGGKFQLLFLKQQT